MWTAELIERLKKYIDGGRYFEVKYQGYKVYGLDLVPPEHAAEYPPETAEFYLEEYDDARPDGVQIGDTQPHDFAVFLKAQVQWVAQDPDWSAADPETYAAYKEATKK